VELEHDVVVGHCGVAGLLLLAVLVQALRGLTRKLSVRLFAPDHLLRVLARRCLLLFLRALGDQHVLLLLLRQGILSLLKAQARFSFFCGRICYRSVRLASLGRRIHRKIHFPAPEAAGETFAAAAAAMTADAAAAAVMLGWEPFP